MNIRPKIFLKRMSLKKFNLGDFRVVFFVAAIFTHYFQKAKIAIKGLKKYKALVNLLTVGSKIVQ